MITVDAWAVLVLGDGKPSLMGPDPKQPEIFPTRNDAAREIKEWDDAKINGWMAFPVRVQIRVPTA